MDVQQAKVESVSNNLANASTPGYKKENIQVKSFPEMLLIQQGGPQSKGGSPAPEPSRMIGTMGTGALVSEISVDYSQGAVQETGNPDDIYLNGPGFFAVNAPAPGDPGRICYTRNGQFKVDGEGYLALNGYRVLGEAGEIQVGDAGFTVLPDGTVEAGGAQVDKLRLVEFTGVNGLRKEGDGFYTDSQGTGGQAAFTTVKQGFLERSNVNVIDEMSGLLSVMRTYETNQKLIQSHDELLSKAVNQVGSLR
jgi:flagellar basal-body rod protein FlgG